MDWLNETLAKYVSEDKMEAVMAEVKKVFPVHAIPKDQYNKVADDLKVANAELVTTKEQMEAVNVKLGTLGTSAEELEAAKATISEMQATHESFVSKADERAKEAADNVKKDSAFERALYEQKADPKLIELFKKEYSEKVAGLGFGDEGEVVGVVDLMKSVKESYPNSFEVSTTIDKNGKPVIGETKPAPVEGNWWQGNQRK